MTTPSPWERYIEDYDDDVPTLIRLYLAALHAPKTPDEDVRAPRMLKVRLATCCETADEVDEAVGLALDWAQAEALL